VSLLTKPDGLAVELRVAFHSLTQVEKRPVVAQTPGPPANKNLERPGIDSDQTLNGDTNAMLRIRFLPTWLLACALGTAPMMLPQAARAQGAGSGTISGIVTDPTGSVVPAASVTLRNTGTGIERKTETNDAGIYQAPFLQP